MKKIIITIFMLTISVLAFCRPVYSYNRDGGKFTFNFAHGFYIGFERVEQNIEFITDGTGKPIEHYYVKCTGRGNLKCTAHTSRNSFIMINNNSFNPDLFDAILMDMIDTIDNKVITNKEFEGSLCRKINMNSNTGTNCLLTFNAVWNLDEDGNGNVTISVNQIIL